MDCLNANQVPIQKIQFMPPIFTRPDLPKPLLFLFSTKGRLLA
jgi:hypothetical protein